MQGGGAYKPPDVAELRSPSAPANPFLMDTLMISPLPFCKKIMRGVTVKSMLGSKLVTSEILGVTQVILLLNSS